MDVVLYNECVGESVCDSASAHVCVAAIIFYSVKISQILFQSLAGQKNYL